MPALFRKHTPVERHRLGRHAVYVKREDLYGRPPAPPLGKLRGLRIVLENAYRQGVRLAGCWDTRVSRPGAGLAAALGGELVPVPAGRLNISHAAGRRAIEQRGGWMLPFGLECPEAVAAVAHEAATVPAAFYEGGTVIVCCGSGVTLAGLLRGL